VIGDDATSAQTGRRQEAIDRPFVGIGMLGDGSENAPRHTPDISCVKMLGEHRRDDLVVGATAAAAYSARSKTGLVLKNGAEMSREMTLL
jgi:hypothetical protein